MSISNDQIVAVVKSVLEDAAEAIALRISSDRIQYGDYGNLSFNQLLERSRAGLQRIVKALEYNDQYYLSQSLEDVQRARIRANYDPKAILATMDLVADELIRAVIKANPGNPYLCETVRRRINNFNNTSKLQFARLNISIPQSDRNENDPDLQKAPQVKQK